MIANITALLAAQGKRVGVIDANIQSPSLHILFNMNEDDITYWLNDYLAGKCDIHQAVYDITSNVGTNIKGDIFVIPASSKADEIVGILKHSHDMERLHAELQQLAEKLNLDILIIDSQSGMNEEALYSVGISDVLAILMRPDRQDYQGTGIIVDVARKLSMSRIMIIVNEAPMACDPAGLKTQAEQTYNCEVAAVVPHSNEMMALASEGIFVLRYPYSALAELYRQIANKLIT